MKQGKTYIVPHRRRREGKTDYRLRLKLLRSGKLRFVVRKSLNNLTCQIIQYKKGGDQTLVSADSRELKDFDWGGHSGNMSAAYLTGLLCGLRAQKAKISAAILDAGLYISKPGNRIYSALKGCLDSGFKISCSSDILPAGTRISGSHIAAFAAKLKKKSPGEYKSRFSQYLKSKVEPENLTKHFDTVKQKILKAKI